MNKMIVTELQRIANIVGVNVESEGLCLLIQDRIKEKGKEINKLRFTNTVLKGQAEKHKIQPTKMKAKESEYKYIDDIKDRFDGLYKVLKKENNELSESNYKLKQEVEYYKEQLFKMKLKGMVK